MNFNGAIVTWTIDGKKYDEPPDEFLRALAVALVPGSREDVLAKLDNQTNSGVTEREA